MRHALAIVVLVMAGGAVARADSGVVVEWHGVRALGLSDDERHATEDVLANALVGSWFGSVRRVDDIAARCGNTVACHCDAARGNDQRYAAFGTVGRIADSWSVELSLIDTHACTVIASALFADDVSPSEVTGRLRALGIELATRPETTGATAVKSTRLIDRTPAIVSTVTAEQLSATQMTTLEDVFASQPGFDVIDTNWGAIPLVQGVGRTLLLVVDGIPQINGHVHLRTLTRDSKISVRSVERIEFVRGPGSVIWGANAFLGVVNIVTREPKSRDGKVDAGLELGSSDSQDLWVNGAQSRGEFALAVSVDASRRRGLRTVVPNSPWATLGVPAGEVAPFGNAGVTQPQADRLLDVGLKLDVGRWFRAMFKNQTATSYYEVAPLGGALLPSGQEGVFDQTWRTYAVNVNHRMGALTLTALASRFESLIWESFAVQPAFPDAQPTDPATFQDGVRAFQGNVSTPRTTHQVEVQLSHVAGDLQAGWQNRLLAGLAALDMHTPTSYSTRVGIDEQFVTQKLDFAATHRRSVSAFGIDEYSPVPHLVVAGGARFRVDAPVDADGVWASGLSLQGGAVFVADKVGAKLVYSEGYRLPDGNSLFSTSGVRGDPTLTAERSRELAGQLHTDVTHGLIARIGGNVTRLSNLISLRALQGDPIFTRAPVQESRTDIVSGYAELQWSSELVDATVRYGITGLRESEPVGNGIPIAPHNLFAAVVARPIQDITLFGRSTAVSPRHVDEIGPGGPQRTRLPWAVRLAVGGTFSNVLPGFDLELRIDNPFNFARRMPYDVTGSPTFVEDRTGSEVFATLRWSK